MIARPALVKSHRLSGGSRYLESPNVFLYAASALMPSDLMPRLQGSILCLLLSCSAAAVSRSVWDGVYTKEQAARGQAAYRENCLQCHGETLGGGEGGNPLAGAEFLPKWYGKSVGDLFGTIRKTMPQEDPGSLASRQYSDIVAYILSVNEFPAGQKELDRDIAPLSEIRIEKKR